MFTVKGLFSEIQCPYSDQCVLPNCLFSHTATSAPPTKPLPASATTTRPSNVSEVPDEPQRKRRRLEVRGDAAPANNSSFVPKIPAAAAQLSPARRDVSPPPLRRNQRAVKETAQNPASQDITPKSKPVTPAKVIKAEALNPRMIKSAPAPHDLRFRLVKALHGHVVRLNDELRKDGNKKEQSYVRSDQELITMVLDMEELVARGKPTIYSNVIKNKILMYKRMDLQGWKDERHLEREAEENAAKAKAGPEPPAAVTIEPPKPVKSSLTPEEELAFLPKLFTPLDGLEKHGYVTSVPNESEIEKAKQGVEAAKGWEVCDRCKARFQVFPGRREEDGALTSGGKCIHHWGKPYWPERSAIDPKAKRERKYRCCEELLGDSPGCTESDTHVFKITEVKRLATILNFEETPENNHVSGQPVCIDGEMGYTVHGLELIRLTATTWPTGGELLDILVRPVGEVLDLNSRWSGVWPQQMTNAVPWSSTSDTGNLSRISL
jgi:RNA exonuclease 1